jgi:hypothetical protein
MAKGSGANFNSGFLSGAFSSLVASGLGGLRIKSRFWKTFATVGSGGLAGGVGSRIAGGGFWNGFGMGLISSGLNHAAHAVRASIQNAKRLVVGIYGAGPTDTRQQRTLANLVEGKGGKMFPHYGSNSAFEYIISNHKGKLIEIYGYSRGGNRAIKITNNLGFLNIRVSKLVTFDPHSLTESHILDYDNVDSGVNFYQRNARTWGPILPFGKNPYLGSPVYGASNMGEVNFTGVGGVNHNNIVSYSLQYRGEWGF